MDLTLRIAGEAGQGIVSVGEMLCAAFVKSGLHVYTGQSYMSRIRGGLNWFDIRVADEELWGLREKPDMLVALSDDGLQLLKEDVAEGAVILYNGDEADGAVAIDFAKVAKEAGGGRIMVNSVAAGAILAVLGYDTAALESHIADVFKKKSAEIVEKNVACIKAGFAAVEGKDLSIESPQPSGTPFGALTTGSYATGLAAATAGVKVASSYPMSPSTATFTWLAKLSDRYGIVVEQAEDEIAAVNLICGATYAGVPAMTTTSGGGFALMCEGVSLAGMMELPIFILDAMRPGPATALPTRTGQEDLKLTVFAGHGEFAKAVFAPGDQRQCYEITRHALETAHRFQTPVILLTDQYMQDATKNIEPLDEEFRPIDRCLAEDAGADYRRYEVTESGISPRTIPGGAALVLCDSDEHDEAGHITEDLDARVRQQDKRMAKHRGLIEAALEPELYGPEDGETLLVCWGSTYGSVREAVDRLNTEGGPVAMLHFAQVWPLDIDKINRRFEAFGRVVVVEGNHTGQLAALLRMEGCTKKLEQMNRYDGIQITAEYVMREVGK